MYIETNERGTKTMMTWEEKMAWGEKVAKSWQVVTMELYLVDEAFWRAAERDGVALEETDVYDMTEKVMDGEW